MFKISIVETRGRRRLILEGKLIQPWTAELESAWRNAAQQLEGRKLVIDLTNVTLINRDGEDALFELMRGGAKFCSGDVLTKHVLKQLARRCRVEAMKAFQGTDSTTQTIRDAAWVSISNKFKRRLTGGQR